MKLDLHPSRRKGAGETQSLSQNISPVCLWKSTGKLCDLVTDHFLCCEGQKVVHFKQGKSSGLFLSIANTCCDCVYEHTVDVFFDFLIFFLWLNSGAYCKINVPCVPGCGCLCCWQAYLCHLSLHVVHTKLTGTIVF